MAFGLSPNHILEIPLEETTVAQALVAALNVAHNLEWKISQKSTTGFVAYTGFSMSSMSEEIQVNIYEDKIIVRSDCTTAQLFDWGKNRRNTTAFQKDFLLQKGVYSAEEAELKVLSMQEELAENEENNLASPLKQKQESMEGWAFFKPTDGYFFTPILILINLLVFIAMVATGVDLFMPSNESLLLWGANFRPYTLDGQIWRLFTSCFLHIGVLHLLLNMYALLYIGLLLEPYLGKVRFLAAYLMSGIVGSSASLYFHDMTISAGASGAIFGMYGVFLALLISNLIEKTARKTLLTSIGVFVAYNLINGLKGGVDNAAHMGGLVSGFVIGMAYLPGLLKPRAAMKQHLTTAGLTVLVLVLSSFVYLNCAPSQINQYDKEFKTFVQLEEKALEIFQLPDDTSDEEYLFEIQQHGIPAWKESIALLKRLDQLNLPEEYHLRNEKLITYCELRLASYELLDKAIRENTNKYQEEIEAYNVKLENILKLMGV